MAMIVTVVNIGIVPAMIVAAEWAGVAAVDGGRHPWKPDRPWSRWCAALRAAAGLLPGMFILLAGLRMAAAA